MLGIPSKLLRGDREKFEEKLKQRIAVGKHLKKQGLELYSKGEYSAGLECLFAALENNEGDFETLTQLRTKTLEQIQRLRAQGENKEAEELMERLKSRLPFEDSKLELKGQLADNSEPPLQSETGNKLVQSASQIWAGQFTLPSSPKELDGTTNDSLSSEESEILAAEESNPFQNKSKT